MESQRKYDATSDTYGFDHECHCDEDFAAGRGDYVTMCFMELCAKAVETCEAQKEAIDAYKAGMSTLRVQLNELGEEPRV